MHTRKVGEVKQRIMQRLQQGFYRPGDRFMSNRAVTMQFGVSYQTAHRLLEELVAEGLLVRRPQSGTFVPGRRRMEGVELVFHPRGRRPGSFGDKLLQRLTARFRAEKIDWKIRWEDGEARLRDERMPVIWESPATVERCVRSGRSAVLINDRPPLGVDALFIDSISCDDYGGGASAAQMLLRLASDDLAGAARPGRSARPRLVILSGPRGDARSALRVAGFTSIAAATTVPAKAWFFEDGRAAAPAVMRHRPSGVFCCNDRLAEGLIAWCAERGREQPAIVGFDDAPIAEKLNLTTIAIPWDELAAGVVSVVKRRLAGDNSASSQQIFHARPVVRGFGAPVERGAAR